MEFIEAPAFTKHVASYLSDENYRALQIELASNPLLGDVMQGTGGLRKVRWADPRRGKGRRGGLRIIYYYFPDGNQIWFMTLYDKNEAADLTPAETKMLKVAIETELKARRQARARKVRRRFR